MTNVQDKEQMIQLGMLASKEKNNMHVTLGGRSLLGISVVVMVLFVVLCLIIENVTGFPLFTAMGLGQKCPKRSATDKDSDGTHKQKSCEDSMDKYTTTEIVIARLILLVAVSIIGYYLYKMFAIWLAGFKLPTVSVGSTTVFNNAVSTINAPPSITQQQPTSAPITQDLMPSVSV